MVNHHSDEFTLSKAVQKQLATIRKLREKGEYPVALERLHKLSAKKLSSQDTFSVELLAIQLQIDIGKLKQASSKLSSLIKSPLAESSPLLMVAVLVLRAEIEWRSARLDAAFETIEKGLILLKKIDPKHEKELKQRKGELLHHRGVVHWYKGALNAALDDHLRSLEIKESLEDKAGIASTFNNLGLVYWSKGDIPQALEFYHRALATNEELGNQKNIGITLTNLGNCYTRMGDLTKALDYQQRSFAIKEATDNQHDIALSLINLGVVYQLKGDLNQAQEYYQRSFEISEQTGNQTDIALVLNNLGNIYELKGGLDQALELFEKGLTIYETLGIKENIALLLANIGGVYRKKGNYHQSLKYYQQSLVHYEEFGNDFLTAIVLFELIWVALEKNDSELVERSLKQLKEINARTENRIIDQRYRVAQALILKSSRRTRQKLKATEILESVVNEEIGDHSLTVTAMIHLSDLLISELKLTGESELITDITKLAQHLLVIAKQQSSHSLLAETYLLQSKLALLEMDMGRANKLLTQAQAISDETGLEKLTQTLDEERRLLDSQMQKWDLLVKEKPSKQELVEITKLDALLERMIQETVSDLMDEKGAISLLAKKKYKLVFLDLLKDSSKHEKSVFKIGIAQIGLSHSGDLLHEFYYEEAPGLFRIRDEKIETITTTLQAIVEKAAAQDIKVLAFPELTIDLNSKSLRDEVFALAKTYDMYLIPGSYHKIDTQQNICSVISSEGVLWKQLKHIPATIHFKQKRIVEGIAPESTPMPVIIANTEYGRIAIIICRDFLDMDLRVELKNFEPPIDIIINPAFTPVTEDFKAIHFDARRSIYAYSFFVNVAEFGESLIYSPEKDRETRMIQPGKEDLIFKEVNLFKLRSARKKWEKEQHKTTAFIQSTR